MKKRCSLNRKGYFFIIDSILALSVLAVGAFLIFTFYSQEAVSAPTDTISEDLMSLLADNKISGINNLEIGLGGTYWSSQEAIDCNGAPITPDSESTLLQQAAIFYEQKKLTSENCYVSIIARAFVEKLAQNNLPKNYNFEFWINDDLTKELIYSSEDEYIQESASKAAAKILMPSKKIVYGILDQQTGDVFGPYSAEVLVWR